MIHLVDDEDLVTDLLLVEERVHEGNKHQQLLEALSEGHDEGQFVRTPGGVVRCRRLTVGRAGRLLGGAAVFARGGGHVARTAELQPEQRDEQQHHAEAEQLVDGTFSRQEPVNTQTGDTSPSSGAEPGPGLEPDI